MKKVAIIGPGLLGGSVALSVRQRIPDCRVGIWARREAAIEELKQKGLSAEDASTDLATAVQGAELVILATPIGFMPDLSRQLLECGAISEGTLVTDVGSVKGPIVEQLTPLFAKSGIHFVGSHPMAGSEKTGLKYATAELLTGAKCIVTQAAATNTDAVDRIFGFWELLEMEPVLLAPEAHDAAVAKISHLPHAAAAALVLASTESDPSVMELSGGGFQDTTRVAAGAEMMWAEIFLENRAALALTLADFQVKLREMLEFLEKEDNEGLIDYLRRAKELRDLLIDSRAPR